MSSTIDKNNKYDNSYGQKMKILRFYLDYLYRVDDTQCDSIGNLINKNKYETFE